MATKIFVNLPVKDLNKSIDFFTKLGYSFNAQFTDEKATCMIIAEDIYVMLLMEPFFKSFIQKDICDTASALETIMALSCESRGAVDAMLAKVLKAGGTELNAPQDLGFMYSRGFYDLDGHYWEFFWMDENNVSKN
jgi:uncharacterized protein